jgi:hypothetical protein
MGYVNEQAVREMSDEELERALEEDSMPYELFLAMKTEQIHREVKGWCNIFGQQSSQQMFEAAKQEIIRRYATMLNVDMHDVSLVNYRAEDEGRTFVWDGIEVAEKGEQ